MSDSFELIRELLPLGSALQDDGNPLRIVLDRTVGEWLDGFEQPYEQLFLTTATGGWLDAHGRQYGVPRKLDETDEDYRQRIVYEKLDELTPSLLVDVYGVRLFSLVDDFNVYGNSLVSDNPYLGGGGFMGVATDDVVSILDKKFILGTGVTWMNDSGELEYILNTMGVNVLSDYSRVYTLSDLKLYFYGNTGISEVKLTLPTATNCNGMFRGCSALTDVDLSLPNATACGSMFYNCSALTDVNLSLPNATSCDTMFSSCSNLVNINLSLPNATSCPSLFLGCSNLVNINLSLPSATSCQSMFNGCTALTDVNLSLPNATSCPSLFLGCSNLVNINLSLPKATGCELMFDDCSSLVNVKLNLPKLRNYDFMLRNAPNIETIDVTIPTNKVSGFKSYVTGLNLQHLTSFKINGEEQL